jgi:hypothetical protein
MDTLKAFSNNCLYSEKIRSFGCPISTRPRSVLFSAKYHSLMLLILIPLSCIKDIEDLLGGDVNSLRSYLTIEHSV